MNEISQQVCAYIRDDYMNRGLDVKPEHRLTADLGIDGDQGVYFIEDFWEEFDTSFAEMDVTKHFACKNSFIALFEFFRDLLTGQNPFKNTLIDLQVSDLIAAVEQGKWSDSILERRMAKPG